MLTQVIKDMIPRYRTMKGHMVPRKSGMGYTWASCGAGGGEALRITGKNNRRIWRGAIYQSL